MSVPSFSVPTQILFGEGVSAQAGPLAKRLGATRVYFVSDPGVHAAGILEPAISSLHEAGLAVEVDAHAPGDPTVADIAAFATRAASFGADAIVAAGGGSGLCTGRATAVAATNGGDVRSSLGHDHYAHAPLPTIAIPTTSGSGSEVSKHITLTDERSKKKSGLDGYELAPRYALLDPALVRTVPQAQAVASGIDAFLHALEAYLSTRATALTDAIALAALADIWTLLPRALEGDDDARGKMLFASSMANVACGNAGLTLVHAMNGGVTYCQNLRGHERVPYGMIHGALLAPILRFYVPAIPERLARLAPLLGIAARDGAARIASEVVEAIVDWARNVGAPPKLPWGPIPDADIDLVVDETLARPRPTPRVATADDLRAIMRQALGVA